MERLDQIYQYNIDLLQQLEVIFKEWRHEPILDFATDVRVAEQLGWTGTHSKSLFLKLKGGGHVLYLTHKDARLDSKAMKQVLGKRPSICSDEEMIALLGCVPGAVCPFGIPEHIEIVVDSTLYQHSEILYTPGHPELTIGIAGSSLPKLLQAIPNSVIEM
ncbi:YbaK/EbsC family protein [Vibrio coralliilyticus]|uniref:YbaK/EbsC family protein n=1 Tax=Vibrio coralliilyticus TaxID=190893 RepID=A0AAP6ZQ50_9VIBR|nr:YbaK/EbsC family protein [Vibrio coralliilyticus]ERB64988.1 DNA-binding protein [Vibrio coralliilyticus OCN008]NOJ26131.1 YbaK/EbsC family protein [Vibrio coralliilyticus]QIJ83873.1 YbaK/EbsC family protein [Vibrio coralliilyticus OCN008]